MISLEQARATIRKHVVPLGKITTPLANAHGRVLRQDIVAAEDFPAFDRAAMDGYAVASDDPSAEFTLVGEVRSGAVSDLEVQAGQCVRVFTGAQMPAGTSQVIIQEHVRREGLRIIPQQRDAVCHVRRRGEDAVCGATLLRAGIRLRAVETALLAQLGVVAPAVSPSPRIIHLVTGDELVAPSAKPGPGQIRDSNSTLVAGLLVGAGARLARQVRCADQLAAIVREAKSFPEPGWDVLLISGGASVGDFDFGAAALTQLGFELHFQAVDLRPGKPLVFATRGRQLAFVIPGNPVSHFVVFQTAISLALDLLEGAAGSWPLAEVTLGSPLTVGANPRETYCPARLQIEAGRLLVHPVAWRSSGDLGALAGTNALIQVLAKRELPQVGEPVACLLLDQP